MDRRFGSPSLLFSLRMAVWTRRVYLFCCGGMPSNDLVAGRVIRPDSENRNLGSIRGTAQISDSMNQFGAGRGICVTRDGVTKAGSHSLEGAYEHGFRFVEVHTSGEKIVAGRRRDLTPQQAHEYSVVDNRTADVGLRWDHVGIISDYQRGVPVQRAFDPPELMRMVRGITRRLEKVERQQAITRQLDTRSIKFFGPPELMDRLQALFTDGQPAAHRLAQILEAFP